VYLISLYEPMSLLVTFDDPIQKWLILYIYT